MNKIGVSKVEPGIFEMAKIAYEIVSLHLTSNTLVDSPVLRDERIIRAETAIKKNLTGLFDAEKLSRVACLSKSQFNRRFRMILGVSPKAYWEKLRFSKICSILKYDDATVAEIAETFGFSSQFYFSRWFKKRAGVSPSKYKNLRIEW